MSGCKQIMMCIYVKFGQKWFSHPAWFMFCSDHLMKYAVSQQYSVVVTQCRSQSNLHSASKTLNVGDRRLDVEIDMSAWCCLS